MYLAKTSSRKSQKKQSLHGHHPQGRRLHPHGKIRTEPNRSRTETGKNRTAAMMLLVVLLHSTTLQSQRNANLDAKDFKNKLVVRTTRKTKRKTVSWSEPRERPREKLSRGQNHEKEQEKNSLVVRTTRKTKRKTLSRSEPREKGPQCITAKCAGRVHPQCSATRTPNVLHSPPMHAGRGHTLQNPHCTRWLSKSRRSSHDRLQPKNGRM